MAEKQSFTQEVKEEITLKQYSEERQKAILSAFIKTNGNIRINNEGEFLTFSTENAKTAKFLYKCILSIYGITPKLSYLKNMRFKKNMRYEIVISESAMDILDDLQVNLFDGKISKNIAFNDDTIGGYLAGAFLARGSVNSPVTGNYHLEIKLDSETYAKWLSKIINRYNDGVFTAKIIKRRNNHVIYLKKSDQISNFLILIGATQSCLYFEGIRVDRDEINNENRLDNIYDANLKKTVKAADEQIEDIKRIDKFFGIDNIKKDKVRLVASARLENNGASLSDIADIVSKKLDKKITKSNVAHIFRKLHEMAERLGK